ncbi:MAG TPA: RNase adapter RapZ [Thermoanaerobaculia bacterium]|nr:RNase adapter RapZ [Thermoanaerobaculia bacterium]
MPTDAAERPEAPPPPRPEPGERVHLVIITGLSGSGKSSVGNSFEDLGYYTVDNLPLPLLREFLDRPRELVPGDGRIAVVADLRMPGFAEEFPAMIRSIDRQAIDLTLLFLEASDESLVRRFSETRRPHPLAPDLPVIEGIRRERELLAELRGQADIVFDTSEWSIHEVRAEVYRRFTDRPGEAPSMAVTLVSFGFKHGIPYGTDLLFDVRFLPNPHFVPGLREQTGRDAPVREYLEQQPDYAELLDRLTDLLGFLLPRYRREHRSYVSVAIGCTGGRHRSVAIAEALRDRLADIGQNVRVVHRDAER